MKKDERLLGLDLLRFLAAFIVAGGHILYVDSPIRDWAKGKEYFYPFRFGFFSVLVFFVLSGYVLSSQLSILRKSPKMWLLSRMTRLLPLYWFTWLIALIIQYLVARTNFNSLPQNLKSGLLGFTASQSLTNSYYIDGPNPPLWSLSVEIYLSLFLLLCAIIPKRLLWLPTLGLFLVLWRHPNILIPITRSLPYFLLGLIANLYKFSHYLNKFSLLRLLLWASLAISLPYLLYGFLNFPWILTINILLPISIILIILLFSRLRIKNYKISKVVRMLGSRTFSLYAIHFPICVLIQHFQNMNFKDKPMLYILIAVLLVAVATELTYRLVEMPSLNLSRSIRTRIP